MKKAVIMAISLSISIVCSFHSLAGQNKLIQAEDEKREIEALQDEVIRMVNIGGARSELSRDITEDDIDFDRAYQVYSNSDLFKKRTNHTEEIKEILQNSIYLWQIPMFIENDTLLVDIYKNTEIGNDVSAPGQWQVGAMYVYDNRTVDYQNTVTESLASAGLNADQYMYEFVNGLPGIRYPVAVVFDEKNAKFITPAAPAAAHAFEEGSEKMEYTAGPNASEGQEMGRKGFPVYYFDDVAKALRKAYGMGIGGDSWLTAPGTRDYFIIIPILIIGIIITGIIAIVRGKNKWD